MKILIFEGIATSGKTTVISLLSQQLKNNHFSYKLITEEESLLRENTNNFAETLSAIIIEVEAKSLDVILFDRFYLSHAFRNHLTAKEIVNIESRLAKHDTKIVFLTIEPSKILSRIENSMELRGTVWSKHVCAKGNLAEIEHYYCDQQSKLANAVQGSSLPSLIFDTTHNGYKKISDRIFTLL
jgi:thymidylate kinase